MKNEPESDRLFPPGCGLWLGWILATIVGTALGWAAAWRTSFSLPGSISTFVIGGTTGLILGFVQWLVLRGNLRGAGWWILANILGWGLGFPAGVLAAQRFGFVEAGLGVMVGVVIGIFLGVCQWLVLRRQASRTALWIPANLFAWASALFFYQPGITGLGVLYGALAGIVTGTVLLWILYRPLPD